jgi:hypothetical protein
VIEITKRNLEAVADSLMRFSPRPGATLDEIRGLWVESKAYGLLGDRKWVATGTANGTDIESELEAILRKSGHGRGALILPNGDYKLRRELNLERYPLIDIIGESKSGVIVSYSEGDKKATIYAKATNSMMSHMTVIRRGAVEVYGGMGVQYAIHDNTTATTQRLVILADIECITNPDIGSCGIGTGVDAGGFHLYTSITSNQGFFAHNADDRRAAWESGLRPPPPSRPTAIAYVNCIAGAETPVSARFGCALTYWNTGSRAADKLIVSGGKFSGTASGIRVVDFGLPFCGESETEVVVDKDSAGVLSTPTATKVTELKQ